ncbi:hypothetical protein SEA_SATIS_225 [Streptomyces phage Satis]|nr:hypothetical protein SEA_SATIS_225 [Streptomyces phage Satis]QBZ72112.1 hypothetical protein SEA_KRADAL_226 [Streptomyces phage Kradal]QPL14533.1 hypothetical protein SEA_EHYELIMAYOE_228 [Streptomyces phage EhyElimayoE]
MSEQYEKNRAERRKIHEESQRRRLENEAKVRAVLDEYHPGGLPDDLVERICLIQNALIRDLLAAERARNDLHDGINRIANEADQRWVDGFRECADQVRRFAAELGLADYVVASLLRNDTRDQDKAAKNAAATRQVEWTRG